MKKTNTSRLGFTLIELLVVVLIFGILAAVALPQYQLAVEKSRATEAINALSVLRKAEEVYFMENGTYTALENLDIQVPEGKYFTYTKQDNGVFAFRKADGKYYEIIFYFSHASIDNKGKIFCGYESDAPQATVDYATKICRALGAKGSGPRVELPF